ncbi:unnamed protein product [Ceratitis capitata]|uniref:Regulatory protein zeste n=1 Tax=Ceratitis capitata TaxID=7213 RepID=A0A811UTA7_CERCA|nr:unnamed protein product [Ceratitis capitata]
MLIKEWEAKVDLARGAPVFAAHRISFDDQWRKVADKLNVNGPPQRSVVEWKKICTDLKSRTKRKIAENQQRLSATGGSPLRFSALTDMEKSIDSILVMSKAAAPSGLVLGIVTLTIQPTMAALSPTTTPPVLSQSSSQ